MILPKPWASAVPGNGCGTRIASTCLPLSASIIEGMACSGTSFTSARGRAVLLEDVAQVIVKRRAELGHADALALEPLDGLEPAVPELLLHHDAGERISRPLPALVGDDPELLAAEDDAVEGGG